MAVKEKVKCACGCGQPTNIITSTHKKQGLIEGEYYRFIAGHQARGKNNSMYGVHRYGDKSLGTHRFEEDNPNWKGGLVKKQYFCKDCGEKISYFAMKRNSRCRDCAYIKLSGEGSPHWKGGISNAPYTFNFNDELKELIRKRDNYKCQICGCPEIENEQKLSIHHIDYNKSNPSPDNLVSLCNSCHSKTNFNPKYWVELFEDKINKLVEVK